MITEDYISFETAKLMNEKGFDEECIYVYRHDGSEDIWDADKEDIACQKPTLQMAMKWLREVHKIHISVDIGFDVDNYQYYFFAPPVLCRFSDNSGEYETPFGEKEFDTYEEACEAAIKYCLENLI